MIGLGAGEPDFDTPDNIKEAAIKAIRDGKTKYTAVDGIPELKAAIVAEVQARERHRLQARQITRRHRRQAGPLQRADGDAEPGDEVVIPAPYWVSYPDIVALGGGTPVGSPTRIEDGFKLQPEALDAAITPKTKWVIFNSPVQPDGRRLHAGRAAGADRRADARIRMSGC